MVTNLPIAHRAVESCEVGVGVLVEIDLPQFGFVLRRRLVVRRGL